MLKLTRQIFIRFLVSLATCLIGIAASVLVYQLSPRLASINRLAIAPSAVPAGWKKINLDHFVFFGPRDLQDQKAHGIDSAVWVFSNESMTVSLDYGVYSNGLTTYSNQLEYREEWLNIGGRKAKVVTFRRDETLLTYDRDLPYVTAVYFPDVTSGGVDLEVWVSCKDVASQAEAKQVLFSFKIK